MIDSLIRTWHRRHGMFLVPVVNVIEVAVDIAVEFALVIPRERPRCRLVACRKRLFFSTFPYVCPEPVLAKRSQLYTYENGAKKAFSCFPHRRSVRSLMLVERCRWRSR